MKTCALSIPFLLLAATMAYTSASRADLNKDSSWREIMSSDKVIAGFPSIPFKNGSLFAIDQTCIDGDTVRPLKTDNVLCTQFVDNGDSVRCAKTRSVILSIPVNSRQNVCLEFTESGICTHMVAKAVDYSRKYVIGVYAIEGESGIGSQPLFTKDYRIPQCQGSHSRLKKSAPPSADKSNDKKSPYETSND